ncbi:ArdC-like ssDNA-binding domain-containing protein [Curtobacterium sp. MCBD17_040]|uniref:ArdC-like ssDNA-binding domain-containing protein n=1 Tax=Curtobacterium sp. MCBD17_040 TaxID=2175674 RepID=UPI000DA8E3EE|nr:ArdC-like ssDNA-binding domain-containing protein [Curtobacterium sp. MCBD17_040]WIB65710.1 ArdC-like ssDNA-binding domain-containing protein [Curtobacterium sp. MCBD17_040]
MSAAAVAVRAKDRGVGRRVNAAGQTLSGGTFAEHNRDADDITLTAVTAPTDTVDDVFTREYDNSGDRARAYLAELDDHVETLATDEGWRDYLRTMSSFRRYSFTNRLLIDLELASRGKAPSSRVAPFSFWEALARKQNPDLPEGQFLQVVKKGEKALHVLGPNTFKETVTDSNGNVALDEDGKPKKREVFRGWSARPVFDISQIDNVTLPDDYQTLSEEPPAGFIEDLEQAVAGAGFTLEEEDLTGSNLGYTTTDGSKRIVVKKGLNPGTRARVLAHELGHVYAGHIERADEYTTGEGGHRGAMEVEADSLSYLVLRANGMSPEVGKANGSYVFGWAKHTDGSAETVRRTGEAVTRAFEKLMTDHNWRNVLEPTGDAKAAEEAELEAIKARIKAEKDAKKKPRTATATKKRAAPRRTSTRAKAAAAA